jgi:hypothetical protein
MHYFCHNALNVGQDSAVSIVTHYGLDSMGIEYQSRQDFLHMSKLALGPIQPPKQWTLGLSRG